jgi:hypothetical protein
MSLVLPPSSSRRRRTSIRGLVFGLCLLQPVARLYGRLHRGLTPWRRRGPRVVGLPRARRVSVWSESWTAPEAWVAALAGRLRPSGAQVLHGGDFDTWDLDVRIGPLASARVRVVAEEHGQGRQMARFRIWPRCALGGAATIALLATLTVSAALQHAFVATVALTAACLWLTGAIAAQATAAVVLPARAAAELDQQASNLATDLGVEQASPLISAQSAAESLRAEPANPLGAAAAETAILNSPLVSMSSRERGVNRAGA